MQENIVKTIIDRMIENLTREEIALTYARLYVNGKLEQTKVEIKSFVEANFQSFEGLVDELVDELCGRGKAAEVELIFGFDASFGDEEYEV